jgi:serine/threonine protein kinase
MGKGTYGSAYLVKPNYENTTYIMKVVDVQSSKEIRDVLGEAIMNILLYEGTAFEPNGPFVPKVYEIGITSDNKSVCVRYERMDNILTAYIEKHSISENEILIPQTLLQIIDMCELLETKFQFNHRDLKSDNIMYVLKDGKPQWRFIDLGASCMKWNGYIIDSKSIFKSERPCTHIGRDITFLVTEFVIDIRNISNSLRNLLKSFISFPIRGQVCALNSLQCKHANYKSWNNLYDLLNNSNVINPKFSMIKNQLLHYLKSPPTQKLKRSFWNLTFRKPKPKFHNGRRRQTRTRNLLHNQ